MAGPRDYNEATKHALFTLASAGCYFPDCQTPTIVFVEGVPSTNVHIAHIKGAKPGSARYDAAMTDEERASFENLLLLCKPHHELVDRIRPGDYPAEVLTAWKHDREFGGLDALKGLSGLTETRLSELLEEAIQTVGPQRVVTAELVGGWLIGTSFPHFPIAAWKDMLDLNPTFDEGERVIAIKARNTGTIGASVESFALFLGIANHAEAALVGRNDFPYLNPDTPVRLEPGDATTWLMKIGSLRYMVDVAEAANAEATGFVAVISLGSGETVRSEIAPVEHLPA